MYSRIDPFDSCCYGLCTAAVLAYLIVVVFLPIYSRIGPFDSCCYGLCTAAVLAYLIVVVFLPIYSRIGPFDSSTSLVPRALVVNSYHGLCTAALVHLIVAFMAYLQLYWSI